MIIFVYEIINVNKVIRERYKDLQEVPLRHLEDNEPSLIDNIRK